MKTRFCAPILTLCLCLVGCEILWPEATTFFESFVVEYNNIDYRGEPKFTINKNNVRVYLPTKIYAHYAYEGLPERWKKDNPMWEFWHEKHRELSQKNGDIGFNMEWPTNWGPYCNRTWNTNNLISAITITSNADYDSAHPAGVSLNDIVKISYISYKSFIENGYKHMIVVDGVKQVDKDRSTNDYSGDGVRCMLSEMQLPDDSVFMDSEAFNLHFTNQPTATRSHTFTVTMEFEQGKPYSFTFDMDFAATE